VARRGFILQPTYRIESGRPVVHLWGTLEDGGAFLVREHREVPRFWVRQADAGRIREPQATVRETAHPPVSMRGEPLVRVEVPKPGDTPPIRDRLIADGVPTFEADVRFAYRLLIDRGIRGSLRIEGPARSEGGIAALWDDPEIAPADWTPQLSVLSIDIETDPGARRLLSVGLAGCGVEEVLLLTPPGYPCPEGARPFATERELLRGTVERVRELDPDVLTGWNVIDFDLGVLSRLAERFRVPLALGRTREPVRIRRASTPGRSSEVHVQGRVVLDGIDLLRGAFLRFESYSLQSVSREVLGRGKTLTGPDRADAILQAFEKDRAGLAEYNLNDARLVLEILDELHLIELAVERSRLTGMPPDRVAASIASFDFLYLSELSRRGIVAPSVRSATGVEEPASGGHVLDPCPGLYRNVLVLDFRSLYPSVIRTFQIDPLGLVHHPSEADDPIVAPNGAAFRREPGILPGLLDDLFPRRVAAKARGDRAADQAIKILMNSFYGVLGTSACRFAHPALANAITGYGREILLWSKARIEDLGYRVLYGDTDSLFVETGVEDAEEARRLGARLVEELNGRLADHVRETWRVESRLELQFERLYLRLLLPAVRHGSAGARKRYAGLVDEGGEHRVAFTGMEIVRRDWTALARRVQRELFERLFSDRPVEEYLREIVEQVRGGRLDDLLVYRKALRKPLDAYTASTPPHVAAARRMSRRPGRIVSYVITTGGPEPADERASPIDHEHYVQKQVRAVAEPVLTQLGLDFDRVVGDDAQLRLF
jgi:DNA polymerase-2